MANTLDYSVLTLVIVFVVISIVKFINKIKYVRSCCLSCNLDESETPRDKNKVANITLPNASLARSSSLNSNLSNKSVNHSINIDLENPNPLDIVVEEMIDEITETNKS